MPPSFDLTDQGWIPVRRVGAQLSDTPVGLTELFTDAHLIADLDLSLPPGSAGLWRVLALITGRVTGLDACDDPAEWQERRGRLLRSGGFDRDAVHHYLSAHRPAFDLFHPERPWLQESALRDQCPKPSGVNKFAWGRTAGQNQVWLGGHFTDAEPGPLSAAEAVHHLLATLYYGPSGRCSSRTVGTVAKADSAAGPLRRVVSYHPVGRTLFETLVLSVPLPDEDADTDHAPWERTGPPDPTGPAVRNDGFAGRLTGQFSHAVLLRPSPDGSQVTDAWVTWGRRNRPEHPPEDAFVAYRTSEKDGTRYRLQADLTRAVWRDLDSLLRESDARTHRPSLFNQLTKAARVPVAVREALRVRCYGFDQDGQTRDKQWFSAETPAVLRWLRDENGEAEDAGRVERRISRATAYAESTGRRLNRALTEAWKESNSPGGARAEPVHTDTGEGPWRRPGTSRYWADAERLFWREVYDDRDDEERRADPPGNAFILAAVDAYDSTTEPYRFRPRVAEAVERHRSALFTGYVPPHRPRERGEPGGSGGTGDSGGNGDLVNSDILGGAEPPDAPDNPHAYDRAETAS